MMPFGLTNAPATFQTLMNDIFQPYLNEFILVYIDDILIYSKDEQQHWEHLRKTFQILQENTLFAKKSKCHFAVPEIEYLGHIVSGQGVTVDPKKTAAIREWPTPKTLKSLRGFNGLTSYYRRFIPGFSAIASPLTSLCKKGSDITKEWTNEHTKAMVTLKRLLTDAPVMVIPDPQESFEVTTDASNIAIGAVLTQYQHPVAYMSQKLNEHQKNYTTQDKELLAVIRALQTWRHFLLGKKFTLWTDYQPL